MEVNNSWWLLILLLLGFLIIPNAGAQQNGVCLVYFTRSDCDDCGLIDTHLDGLVNEYSNILTVIKYNIDGSQKNMDIFGAYRYTYDLPSDTPLVLFGTDNYLVGIDDIYSESEIRIIDFIVKNGTNCPLESGYVPPSQLNPGTLPGEFEILEGTGDEGTGEGMGKGEDEIDRDTKGNESVSKESSADIVSIIRDSLVSPDLTLLIMILIIIVLVIGIVIAAKKG